MSKRSKSDAERSKIEAEKMRLAGASQEEIRAELGGVRSTTWRWLKDVGEIDWNGLRQEELGPARKAFVEQMIARADDVLSGRLDTDAANAWRGLMEQISRVVGLEAPKRVESRSTRINIDADIDPVTLTRYRRFCFETKFKSDEQLETVYAAFRLLPNVTVPKAPMQLPDSAENWGDWKRDK